MSLETGLKKEELELSRQNYSKYYEKNRKVAEETVEEIDVINEAEELVVENPAPDIVLMEETVETVTIPETVVGTVVGCTKLNVRENPNTAAAVLCVLDAASEIKINVTNSNNEWVNVLTAAGIDGYCMRKFVNANL